MVKGRYLRRIRLIQIALSLDMQIYYVEIETKDGTRVGQFGYRVIDKSARRIDVWMSGGNSTRYYNLAERLHFSERGGSVRISSS